MCGCPMCPASQVRHRSPCGQTPPQAWPPARLKAFLLPVSARPAGRRERSSIKRDAWEGHHAEPFPLLGRVAVPDGQVAGLAHDGLNVVEFQRRGGGEVLDPVVGHGDRVFDA